MKKVILFFANGTEEIEALTAVDLLRRAGAEVTLAGVGGRELVGSHAIRVTADIDSAEITTFDYDMAVVPGGMPGTLHMDGSPAVDQALSEVYQSVMIGWDLEKRPKFNVENEIDVVLMKQGIPIFISCKMTNPKPEDLNEIFALAGSFGGYGAIPALATSTDVRNRATTLWNRAQEMGVTLIDHNLLNRDGLLEFFAKI